MQYDLLITGGSVYDSTQGLAGDRRDIAIRDGKVAAVASDLSTAEARQIVDASGVIVTPGLIDLHVHVYDGVGVYGIDADTYCLRRGVTTAIDTGSAGALTFPAFRRHVIDRARTRVFALLHIAEQGIISRTGELRDLRQADVEKAVEVARANRDVILGMKIRLGKTQVGDHPLEALDLALEAATATDLPLMVHISDLAMPIEEMLPRLRPGDILTHCFEEQTRSVLDDDDGIRRCVLEAVERGILLDVGHGMGSFSLEVARAALAAGLKPHTISSDVHALNIEGPVFDQVTTLSKFLSLGMSLAEVVERSTIACVESLGLPRDLGHLQPGAQGDLTLLSLDEGDFDFTDSKGRTWQARQNLETAAVVKAGSLIVDYRSAARAAV